MSKERFRMNRAELLVEIQELETVIVNQRRKIKALEELVKE